MLAGKGNRVLSYWVYASHGAFTTREGAASGSAVKHSVIFELHRRDNGECNTAPERTRRDH
jgi:hypothetical protein